MEYPKFLCRGWDVINDNVVVQNEEAEALARKKGYIDLSDKKAEIADIELKNGSIPENDKNALEEYAREHLSIELDRRKNFDSLLKIVRDFENGDDD